jgi:NAD(P)-dependent dehydrogenase (short-subunit alcohol dehydrogenase family)/phosphopantetheinyl transferase
VKQAEIFGEMRERFGVSRDDSFRLADHPTIGALASWLSSHAASATERPSPDVLAPRAVDEPPRADVQPSATVSPGWMQRSGLPEPFRMRRTVWQARTPTAHPSVRGMSFRVLGAGSLAESLRALVSAVGAERAGAPDVVVEVGGDVESAFRLARSLDATPPRHWMCVVEAPGSLAAAQSGGARAGLARGLGREWPQCAAHVVEVAPNGRPDDVAEMILRELSEVDGAVDVRLDGTTRWVGVLEVDAPPPAGALPGNPVVVLTGGMRGITARVAQAFAEAGPCTLVLVGRTAPGPAPLDEDAARRQIRARLEASGERVVPRRMEEALAPLRVAEEARRTVASLRAMGANVEVRTCDLADPVAVASLVGDVVARHGRVDACVHGAGVEESRKLAEKDERAFHRVFDGKAVGGLVLAGALPSSCWFVSMGSIAGRFGNEGQVDYAAANEAMARVCAYRPRSIHVSWTAWADTGMAARGGMDVLLETRGIDRLPPVAGAALVRDLVAAGASGEWVVSGRLGDLLLPALHPLLDACRLDGDAVVVSRALNAERDPWLSDHAIGGVPVLPGVVGLEWMLAAARLVRPAVPFSAAEDVRFLAPLKVHRDGTVEVEVRAEPDGVTHVRCVVRSRRTGATGRRLEVDHFTARFPLEAPTVPALLEHAAWPVEQLLRRDVYRRFFHGPAFQVLEGTDRIAVSGLVARARVVHAPIAEGLAGTPLVVEAAFQAAGLHRMVVAGVLALPSAVERVVPVRRALDGEPLRLWAVRRGDRYDVDVLGADGPVLIVRGFHMADLGPMDPRDRFVRPGDGGQDADAAGSPEASSRCPSDGARAAVVAAWADSVEASVSLPEDERAWLTARGTQRRHADRLAGQLAARRAVHRLLGHASFRVLRRPSGEPWVEGADVRVSISHVEGRAVALATYAPGVGVDVEDVVAREPAFLRTWFTAGEQARLRSDRDVTCAWAVKEAVLKALGVGMRLSPRDVEVWRITPRAVDVRAHGEVAALLESRGNPPLLASIAEPIDGRVVATVVLAA